MCVTFVKKGAHNPTENIPYSNAMNIFKRWTRSNANFVPWVCKFCSQLQMHRRQKLMIGISIYLGISRFIICIVTNSDNLTRCWSNLLSRFPKFSDECTVSWVSLDQLHFLAGPLKHVPLCKCIWKLTLNSLYTSPSRSILSYSQKHIFPNTFYKMSY